MLYPVILTQSHTVKEVMNLMQYRRCTKQIQQWNVLNWKTFVTFSDI